MDDPVVPQETESMDEKSETSTDPAESDSVAVWIRESSAEGYIEGVIIDWPMDDNGEPSQEVVLVSARGRTLEVHPDDILERDDSNFNSIWCGERANLISVPVCNEAEVLSHLLSRSRADTPYTKCGDDMVIIKPNRWLPESGDESLLIRLNRSYGEQILEASQRGVYKLLNANNTILHQDMLTPANELDSTALLDEMLSLPPHPYVEAKAAILRCCPPVVASSAQDRPQLFVLAGDAGSGKSHTAKLLIHFISSCAVEEVPPPVSVASVLPPLDNLNSAVKAIQSMPQLLDYFGSTPGLSKQSRFGSLTTMYMSEIGKCIGGSVEIVVPLDCSPLDKLMPNQSSPNSRTYMRNTKNGGLGNDEQDVYSFPIYHALRALLQRGPFDKCVGGLKPTLPKSCAYLLLPTNFTNKVAETSSSKKKKLSPEEKLEEEEDRAAREIETILGLLTDLRLSEQEKQSVFDLATAVFCLARGAVSPAAELLGIPSLVHVLDDADRKNDTSTASKKFSKNSKSDSQPKNNAALMLARVLHRLLFDWLVGCINDAATPPQSNAFNSDDSVNGDEAVRGAGGDLNNKLHYNHMRSISVLDIPGFEFGTPAKRDGSPSTLLGFESLLANTASEILASFVHQQSFVATHETAERQGVILPYLRDPFQVKLFPSLPSSRNLSRAASVDRRGRSMDRSKENIRTTSDGILNSEEEAATNMRQSNTRISEDGGMLGGEPRGSSRASSGHVSGHGYHPSSERGGRRSVTGEAVQQAAEAAFGARREEGHVLDQRLRLLLAEPHGLIPSSVYMSSVIPPSFEEDNEPVDPMADGQDDVMPPGHQLIHQWLTHYPMNNMLHIQQHKTTSGPASKAVGSGSGFSASNSISSSARELPFLIRHSYAATGIGFMNNDSGFVNNGGGGSIRTSGGEDGYVAYNATEFPMRSREITCPTAVCALQYLPTSRACEVVLLSSQPIIKEMIDGNQFPMSYLLQEGSVADDEDAELGFHRIQLDPLGDLAAALTRHSVSDIRVMFCVNPNPTTSKASDSFSAPATSRVSMTSHKSVSSVLDSQSKAVSNNRPNGSNKGKGTSLSDTGGKDGLNILRQIRNLKLTDLIMKHRCNYTSHIPLSHFISDFYPLFRDKINATEDELNKLKMQLKEDRYRIRGTVEDARGMSSTDLLIDDEEEGSENEDPEEFESLVIDGVEVMDVSSEEKSKPKAKVGNKQSKLKKKAAARKSRDRFRSKSGDLCSNNSASTRNTRNVERNILLDFAERILNEEEVASVLSHGFDAGWMLSPSHVFLCSGGVNKLNSLRLKMLEKHASLIQKNLSAFGSMVVHNARLVRNNIEQLSLVSYMNHVINIDNSDVIINSINRLIYDCNRVLLLEKAQPDAGYLIALKFPYKRNELMVKEALQRVTCMDESLCNVSAGISELVGRLCSVQQALDTVEQDELLLMKDGTQEGAEQGANQATSSAIVMAVASSSSSFSLHGMLSKSKRQVDVVKPMIDELIYELNVLRKIRVLRLAGRHILDFPQPISTLAELLNKDLTDRSEADEDDNDEDANNNNHLLLSLNSDNFVNDCDDLLAKCVERSPIENALTQAEESVAALLDLQATAADTCNEVNMTRTEIRRNLVYLNDLVDRLGVRDDDGVSELLRDITESSRSALKFSNSYDRSEERLLSSLLNQILEAMDSVTAISVAKGEREAFDQIVQPMLNSLRNRIEVVTGETSPAVLTFRNAAKSGYAEAFTNAENAVTTIESLIHQSGQSENCIRMLSSATDLVCELEHRNNECLSLASNIEKQKVSCRRRLLPATDAMKRLTKRLELDPQVGEDSVKARADAVEALEAARQAIDAHGSYLSRLQAIAAASNARNMQSMKHQGKGLKKSRGHTGDDVNESLEKSGLTEDLDQDSDGNEETETDEQLVEAMALQNVERTVDNALRLVSLAERLHISDATKRINLLQESSLASTKISEFSNKLAGHEAEAARQPRPTLELSSEASENAARAISMAPRKIREASDISEIRKVVFEVESLVSIAINSMDEARELVGTVIRGRANFRTTLAEFSNQLKQIDLTLLEERYKFNGEEQYHSSSSSFSSHSQKGNHQKAYSGFKKYNKGSSIGGSGSVSRRGPLPCEEVAVRLVSEAKSMLLTAENAIEQPLNISQLELALNMRRQDFQDHHESGTASMIGQSMGTFRSEVYDEEVKKTMTKLQAKLHDAEIAVNDMGKEIDTIIRVSTNAGHQVAVLERQLTSVKERRVAIFTDSSSESSSSNSGSYESQSKKKLNEAEHGILRAKRLLDELRSGVTDSAANEDKPLHAVLLESISEASTMVEEADALVEAEVARSSAEDGARTAALMRLNEVTMTLQGVIATAEASGHEVQSLVEADLSTAKSAVQSCFKIIENPPDIQQHISKLEMTGNVSGGGGHMTAAMEEALNLASDATATAERSVEKSVEQVTTASASLRKFRERSRQLTESAQILTERSIRSDVHRSTACIATLKTLDIAVAMFQRCAQVDVFEYLRDPNALSAAAEDATKSLRDCESVLQQLTQTKKLESTQERQARRDMDILVRRHSRAVDQAAKWGIAGDGAVQRCFAATEEALALGRSSLNSFNGSTKHRLMDIKHHVTNEETMLITERKRQEEAHFDVQRAMLALPDLKRRSTMLEANVGLLDLAVRELVSQDLADMNEAMVIFEGWLDFRSFDGQIHFAQARDGVVVSLERAQRAVKEAESNVELQTQRVKTAKTEQAAERSRLGALESKLHSLTGSMATLSAAASSSYTARSAFAPLSNRNEINLTPISEAIGTATKKLSRARSLVEVPASDWVIMSLMTSAKNVSKKENVAPTPKKEGTKEDGSGGEDIKKEDEEEEGGMGLDEGPFANMGHFADVDGPDVETAHEAVEKAALAIAHAEKLLRDGERRHQSLVSDRKRFESQLQSVVERFGGALATAHAAGVADWPEIASMCEEAESSLGYVRQALGETGESDSAAVQVARSALDAASSKVESVESAISEAWQRSDQRKAEEQAAMEVAREAITRWKDVVEAAEVYELNNLPVVEASIEAASSACRNAQLSIKQADSLPLVVITEDAKKALEAVEELERVVSTQRISRDHFDEAEQQREHWQRVMNSKKNESVQAKQSEEQMQLRKLRDQLEAVHIFLANKSPDVNSTVASFTRAKEAIYAAQEQLSENASVSVVSASVAAAVNAVEAAVSEQAASTHQMSLNREEKNKESQEGFGDENDTPPELVNTASKMARINEELMNASKRLKDQDRILELQSNILNGVGDREAQLAELLSFQTNS